MAGNLTHLQGKTYLWDPCHVPEHLPWDMLHTGHQHDHLEWTTRQRSFQYLCHMLLHKGSAVPGDGLCDPQAEATRGCRFFQCVHQPASAAGCCLEETARSTKPVCRTDRLRLLTGEPATSSKHTSTTWGAHEDQRVRFHCSWCRTR